MSTDVANAPEDAEVQAEDTPDEVQPPQFPDEAAKVTFTMVSGLIDERNGLVAKINAVKGDADALRTKLEESSTDPAAVQARAARDQAQAALDEALEALHAAVDEEVKETLRDADGTAKEIEEKIKEADGTIKPALNFFKKMYATSTNLVEHLPPLERLKGFSTRGAGTGRRVRGYNATVTEANGKSTTFDNLATAAKFLALNTVDLQNAFFTAAGNPEALKDAPDDVNFEINYTETYDDESTEEVTAKIECHREAKDEAPAAETETETTDEADPTEGL